MLRQKATMFFKQLCIQTAIFTSVASSFRSPLFDEVKIPKNFLPRGPTFPEMARNMGFQCEEYNVTTSDGYILQLFRIPGDVTRPALYMHGLLDSADGLILRNNCSLGWALAKAGYDVWVGNKRGNKYSRHHLTLDPDTDDSFWDFSFHEMGYYDLPAIIDFVLDQTGQSQLSALGHSEGTTIFFILGSTRPEYNKKIKIFAALAPIAYLQNTRGIMPILIKFSLELNAINTAINYQELFGPNSDLVSVLRKFCNLPVTGNEICRTIAFQFLGNDPAQFEREFLPIILQHFPAGSSRKAVTHYLQVGRRKQLAEYDYGCEENLKRYGTSDPPVYNLSKVTFDLAMYCGAKDLLSTLEDVAILRSQIPETSLVEYKVIDYKFWNHFDFLYGKFIRKYLSPLILELLNKYNI